jgi:hypothetical protein
MSRNNNPYAAFKSDYYRYKALLSRDRRYFLIAIVVVAADCWEFCSKV